MWRARSLASAARRKPDRPLPGDRPGSGKVIPGRAAMLFLLLLGSSPVPATALEVYASPRTLAEMAHVTLRLRPRLAEGCTLEPAAVTEPIPARLEEAGIMIADAAPFHLELGVTAFPVEPGRLDGDKACVASLAARLMAQNREAVVLSAEDSALLLGPADLTGAVAARVAAFVDELAAAFRRAKRP